jgi:hypothetical protein
MVTCTSHLIILITVGVMQAAGGFKVRDSVPTTRQPGLLGYRYIAVRVQVLESQWHYRTA